MGLSKSGPGARIGAGDVRFCETGLQIILPIPGARFILTDGYVGQLKESYEMPDTIRPFSTTAQRDTRTSIYVREGVLEEHNWKLFRRFEELKKIRNFGYGNDALSLEDAEGMRRSYL